MEQQTGFRDTFLRLVAIVGLIAVLILGAWGIILLAFNLVGILSGAGSAIGSIFNHSDSNGSKVEAITISVPATVTSGNQFELDWKHENGSGNYGYAVSYACATGLSVMAPTSAGGFRNVACNTAFNYTNAQSGMPLIAKVSGTKPVQATFIVSATDLSTNQVTSSDSATITVNPGTTSEVPLTGTSGSSSAAGSTGTPSAVYTPASRTTALYGLPDLTVQILSITSLNSAPGRIAMQFAVTNVGTNIAQAGWNFNALLPLNPVYTYVAAPQRALYPGDKIVYTMTFDAPYGYNQYYGTGCNYQTYPYQNCSGTGYYPYQMYPYQQTCYTYNGYANIPAPCDNTNYAYSTTYPNYNYNYGYQYQGANTVTITVDPNNWLPESSKYNNTASRSF